MREILRQICVWIWIGWMAIYKIERFQENIIFQFTKISSRLHDGQLNFTENTDPVIYYVPINLSYPHNNYEKAIYVCVMLGRHIFFEKTCSKLAEVKK